MPCSAARSNASTRSYEKTLRLPRLRHPEMARMDEMIPLLVTHGADLDTRDKAGKTLLDRALAHEFVEFGDILRAHGATGRN